MRSTIRLFRAVPITIQKGLEPSKELLKRTMKNGYILAPEVILNYPDIDVLLKILDQEIGLSGEQMNASFHKSWEKVRNASLLQLVMEQILHYFTTYGFERLGIYDKNSVYVPCEALEIPDLDIEGFNFIVIKGYTKTELKKKLLVLLSSGIALKEKTTVDIVDVAMFTDVTESEVEAIKNKETKA